MREDIRAVVFDLDGTLLDRRTSFELFARNQWERFQQVLGGVERQQYVDALIELDGDGYTPRKLMFAGASTRLGFPGSLAEILLSDYRDGFARTCLLFPDAVQTLSRLRESGLKVGLITNGSARMQSRKIECLALAPLFDSILISDLEGLSKPDPRIFHRACDQLNTHRAQAVYVGDHPEVDVAGAHAAGMRTIWRRVTGLTRTVEPDGIIEEIAEVVTWLELPSPRLPGTRL